MSTKPQQGDKEFTPRQFSDLFPYRDVGEGTKKVRVYPIPLPEMTTLIEDIIGLAVLTEQGKSEAAIGAFALSKLNKYMPCCLEIPMDAIPGPYLPLILEAMIELNIGESVLKNWLALVNIVKEKLADIPIAKTLKGQGSTK